MNGEEKIVCIIILCIATVVGFNIMSDGQTDRAKINLQQKQIELQILQYEESNGR